MQAHRLDRLKPCQDQRCFMQRTAADNCCHNMLAVAPKTCSSHLLRQFISCREPGPPRSDHDHLLPLVYDCFRPDTPPVCRFALHRSRVHPTGVPRQSVRMWPLTNTRSLRWRRLLVSEKRGSAPSRGEGDRIAWEENPRDEAYAVPHLARVSLRAQPATAAVFRVTQCKRKHRQHQHKTTQGDTHAGKNSKKFKKRTRTTTPSYLVKNVKNAPEPRMPPYLNLIVSRIIKIQLAGLSSILRRQTVLVRA